MKLKKAVYKFWIGREDRVMRRALRIVEYRMSVNPFTGQEIPPDGEKVTMKLEVDAELFDYDRDVEIEIPDEAAAALKEAVEKDATPAK